VRLGSLLPPARVTRYIDANPVDIQLDIPMLGQFRVYFLCPSVKLCKDFLSTVSVHVCSTDSGSIFPALTAAARSSYNAQPVPKCDEDAYLLLGRYKSLSDLFTFALVTGTAKADFEIAELPQLLRESKWTVYLDDIPDQDTRRQTCLDKWAGPMAQDEIAIVNVRPDGYVGSARKWNVGFGGEASGDAISWLERYYGRFLEAGSS
jgi:phenol 2-monooxygenase (NADPH)